MSIQKASLYIVLFVTFVDFMGIGLIYPLFSTMLFDCNNCLVPTSASQETRGLLLGILIALMPLTQFFTAPLLGARSDSVGRKKPLVQSLVVNVLSYVIALIAILINHLWLLLASRAITGVAAGNMSIVQATIADISSPQEKAKNFGLFSMAMGAGFTLGPFFGGALSSYGYSVPFIFASLVAALNLFFAVLFFKETHTNLFDRPITWTMGLEQIKKAFQFKGLRTILFASFLHNFAWSYFFEFVPVYLIGEYSFTAIGLGFFYALAGAFYALSAGLLIRPFVSRFSPVSLFFWGNSLAGITIISILLLPDSTWLWPFVFLIAFFVAFVTPSSTTFISNSADDAIQGEALGVLSSVNAAALILSPLLSGSLVGKYHTLPMSVGGSIMVLAALLVLIVFRSSLFVQKK